MGRIRNAIGRLFTPVPAGIPRSAYVRGSIARRQVPFDNRVLPGAADLDSGSDVIAALLSAQVADLVGTGVRPTIDTGNTTLDSRLMLLWEAWGRDAEVSGLTWDDTIALACRLWLRDGEAWLVLNESGRVQLLAAADLPASVGNQGVEVDAAGRPVAYHFQPGLQPIRVPAESVLGLLHRTNPRQHRGVSPLLPALEKVGLLNDYDVNEGRSAALAARAVFTVKSQATGGMMPVEDDDGDGGEEIGSINFTRLMPGEEASVIHANRPNPELSNYRRSLLRAIAASVGQADYCAVSMDSPGSFSASRHLSVIAQRSAEVRWAAVIRNLLDPLFSWLAAGWRASGQIAVPSSAMGKMKPTWVRQGRPDWIDPARMAEAMAKLLDAGLATKEELRQHFSGFGQ